MAKDDIGSATRALAEAVSALTRSVTQNLSDLSQDVNAQVAGSLRAASAELSEASTRIHREQNSAARKRSDQTRRSLLRAARSLFAERGYEAASLGDVATRAGYTKGAVYANFSGKEDLLLAVVADVAAQIEQWVAERAGLTAAEVLADLAQTAGREDQLLFSEITLYTARHPEVRTEVTRLLGPGFASIADLIAATRGHDSTTPDDLADTVGLLSICTYAHLVTPFVEQAETDATLTRAVRRLLELP